MVYTLVESAVPWEQSRDKGRVAYLIPLHPWLMFVLRQYHATSGGIVVVVEMR